MNCTFFEPGDATRYLVGVSKIDPSMIHKLGYSPDSQVILFCFGPASHPNYGMIDITNNRSLAVSDIAHSMGFTSAEVYSCYAAAYVLWALYGVKPFGPQYEAYARRFEAWDNTWIDTLQSGLQTVVKPTTSVDS